MVKVHMAELQENNQVLKRQVKELNEILDEVAIKMVKVPNSEHFSGASQQAMLEYTNRVHKKTIEKLKGYLSQLTDEMDKMIVDFKNNVDNSDIAFMNSDELRRMSRLAKSSYDLSTNAIPAINRTVDSIQDTGAGVERLDEREEELLFNLHDQAEKTHKNLVNFHNRGDVTGKFAELSDQVFDSNRRVNDFNVMFKEPGTKEMSLLIVQSTITQLAKDGWNEDALESYEKFISNKLKKLDGASIEERIEAIEDVFNVGSDAFIALIKPYGKKGASSEGAKKALDIMFTYLGAELVSKDDGKYLKIEKGFPILDPFHNELLLDLLPKVVQNAFPFEPGKEQGGLAIKISEHSEETIDLAIKVHQLRYLISYSNAVFVEKEAKKLGLKPAEFLDLMIQAKPKGRTQLVDLINNMQGNNINGLMKYSDVGLHMGSARPHNKISVDFVKENKNQSTTKLQSELNKNVISLDPYHNYKLLVNPKQHVEFIVNNKTGEMVKVNLNKTIGKSVIDDKNWKFNELNGFINGASYNYGNSDDMYSTSNPKVDNEDHKYDKIYSTHYNYDYNYNSNFDMPNRSKATGGKDKIYTSPDGDTFDKNTKKSERDKPGVPSYTGKKY